PWLYLGSGNLTGPGFANAMSERGGNLELGIVFSPGRVLRRKEREPENYIGNRLPYDPEDSDVNELGPLQSGGEMPPREASFVSPPIAWLIWQDQNHRLRSPDPDDPQDWCVLGPDDGPLEA